MIKSVVRSSHSDVSKGYGFINCENKKTYDRILNTKSHFILGRQVEVNQAIKKNEDTPENIKAKALKKIFVGGLTDQADRDALYYYFSQFGEVTNAYVIYDPNTKQSKSTLPSPDFGYVEFQLQEDANSVLALKQHSILGKKVSLQLFKTKDEQWKGLQKQPSPHQSGSVLEQTVPTGLPDSHDTADYPPGSSSTRSPDLATYKFVAFQKTEAISIVGSKAHSGPKSRTRPAAGRLRKYAEFYASLLPMSEKRDSYESTSLSSNLRINRAAVCHAGRASAR